VFRLESEFERVKKKKENRVENEVILIKVAFGLRSESVRV